MTRRAIAVRTMLLLLTVPLAAPADAQDAERVAMARVRLTTEPVISQGCSRIGTTRDNDIKDLRRKIVRMGGNAAHLAFGGIQDLEMVYAEVFRCADPPAGAPGSAPAGVPPPPPGPPPPPPPPTR